MSGGIHRCEKEWRVTHRHEIDSLIWDTVTASLVLVESSVLSSQDVEPCSARQEEDHCRSIAESAASRHDEEQATHAGRRSRRPLPDYETTCIPARTRFAELPEWQEREGEGKQDQPTLAGRLCHPRVNQPLPRRMTSNMGSTYELVEEDCL